MGEYNPRLRRSYAEIAGESRSQHKSQGFGALQRKGVVWNYITRLATRVNESTPAKSEKDIFEGVIPSRVDVVDYGTTRDFLEHISLEAIADRQYVALGDSARVTVTFYNRSDEAVRVRPTASAVLSVAGPGSEFTVAPDSTARWILYLKGQELTQPWWLATPRNGDLFAPPLPRLANASLWFQTPEDARQKSGWASALVMPERGGVHMYDQRAPVVFRTLDPVRGDVQRPVAIVPEISISLDRSIELAAAGTRLDRFINITLRSAAMKAQPVEVALALPRGLSADSASRTITVDSAGTRRVTFRVRGTLAPGAHSISATATAAGRSYSSGFIPIEYDHIDPRRLYRPSRVKIQAVDVRIPANTRIAYVQGVGDNVAPALEQLGIQVTAVDPVAIPTVDFSQFTAVVVGPRAYDAHRELMDNNSYLLDYARNGGTLVVQYGQYEMMRPGVMPYPITIARPHDRVTEEVAPVAIIDPAARVLTQPNRITGADFQGWVQERSLYMPRTFDERYKPVFELNDPGAPPSRGSLLIAPLGKGLYVYTTLAFFRQLPAGVPGATRLFVNLLTQKQ